MSGSTGKSKDQLIFLPVMERETKDKEDCAEKTHGSPCLGSIFPYINCSKTVDETYSSISVVARSSSSTNSDPIETSSLLEKSASTSLQDICGSSVSSNEFDSKDESCSSSNPRKGENEGQDQNMSVLSQPIAMEQVEELTQMFPLYSTKTIKDTYFLCNENIVDTIDHLLAKNLVDRERDDQSMPSNSIRPLCKLWVSNQCGGARAAACTDRHYFIDTDTRKDSHVGQSGPTRSLSQFSSPFREQVLTEQVLVSKEQVDLESGTAETVWEIQNREVVDLTGA